MDWKDGVVKAFKENDIEVVAYLPDSVLAPLIDQLEEESFETVLVAREEEAVGVLAGAWLGGRRGALVCQTSGLANTFNAIGSCTKPWGIPFIGIVGRRGALGEHNLAQIPAGYGMPDILDTLGVRNHHIDGSLDTKRQISMGIETAFATEDAYVFLIESTVERKA
jgi:sulfopyruvate decarboxylase alpha subunit